MASLAAYLQQEFANKCPSGWTCRPEIRLLSDKLESFLGYKPRVDVLLARADGSQRLWIEFEVSRADPVANHAKFATAHLFQPQPDTDAFLSMISSHVIPGRQNLAANTILLMRYIGMNAFQTVLLPHKSPAEIKCLNHLSPTRLAAENLDVKREIQRAISVSQVVLAASGRYLHFVGHIREVMLNLQRWNEDLATPQGRALWGKRTITYFVFDPRSKSFAPSKFCAYLSRPTPAGPKILTSPAAVRSEMTVNFYVTLDRTERRFDGHRAHSHLENNLAMSRHEADEVPQVFSLFEQWLKGHGDSITLHCDGPVFLLPPGWFG